MNKKWLRILPVFFLSAIVLIGCNNNDPAEEENDTQQTPENDNMNDTNENNDILPDGENGTNGNNDILPDGENGTNGNNDLTPDNGENNEDIIEDNRDMNDTDNKDE